MKISPLFVAATAFLALAACKPDPEVVDSRAPDPMSKELENRPAVVLPPSIKAAVSMRCQPGNALVFADFFEGDTLVAVATEKGGTKTRLTAPAAGEPFVAEGGYKLTGTSKAATVEIPGKGTLNCKG
jgi:hypothetical protein